MFGNDLTVNELLLPRIGFFYVQLGKGHKQNAGASRLVTFKPKTFSLL